MAIGFVQRIVGWMRAGYPEGIPHGDYVALLGILHRRLTDSEVDEIAGELAAAASVANPVTESDIRGMIADRVFERASKRDVARVSALLAAAGWPLADADNAMNDDQTSSSADEA